MKSNKGMTFKEIADFVGVKQKIINQWARKVYDDNFTEIAAKYIISQDSARFTLEEVLSILQAGGRHDLVEKLKANTKNNPFV